MYILYYTYTYSIIIFIRLSKCSNLAELLLHSRNNFEEAEQLYQTALEMAAAIMR